MSTFIDFINSYYDFKNEDIYKNKVLFSLDKESDFYQAIIYFLIANLLVTAVPIGGGTISEMLIITMMGYPRYTCCT